MIRLAPAFASFVLLAPSLAAQTTLDVDVTTGGLEPALPAVGGGMSGDARIVAFASSANDLVIGDPGSPDVFWRDVLTGATTRITNSFPANYSNVRVSGDGRFVGYSQVNFGTPIAQKRAFVHDRVTGTTAQVAGSWQEVSLEDLNQDGRYALVTARPAGVAGASLQVVRVDMVNGREFVCTLDANGAFAVNGEANVVSHASIDADGTHVAFASNATNLIPGDTNGVVDVFVYDIPGNVRMLASANSSGVQATGASLRPSIAKDGRFVAFESFASNLDAGDANGLLDVYVRDLRFGTTTRASLTTLQEPYTSNTSLAAISGDARFVAFTTIVQTGLFSSRMEVRLRDLENGVTLPMEFGAAAPDFRTQPLDLSDDGRTLLVDRLATALSPLHLRLLDYGAPCSTANYCTANPNSTGVPAFLSAQGAASREQNNLVFAALDLPPTAVTLLYSGTSAIDPGVPFGDGLQCVGGAMIRHVAQQAVAGTVIAAQDVRSPAYAGVLPGDTRYYQVLYRDPDAGGAGFNTTDAVAVTFCW